MPHKSRGRTQPHDRKPTPVESQPRRPADLETLVLARERPGMYDRWHCGACGQEIALDHAHGWVEDPDDGVCRPTKYSLRQRRRSEERLQGTSLSSGDRPRERERLRDHVYGRSRERPRSPIGADVGYRASKLSKNYAECPRCHEINALNPTTIPYRLVQRRME